MQNLSRQARLEAELVDLIPVLKRFARRFVSNQNDLDDLVQEALIKALSNLDKFTEGTNLRSWLFTITRNAFCTEHHRKKRVAYGFDESWSKTLGVAPAQEWNLHLDDFHRSLQSLPVHQREALDVIVLQGTAYDAAAEQLGCPIGTIKSRVNRARVTLAERLSGDRAKEVAVG
jgi:RNA polymerase sigma-70 factor (ECF subfamily)